MPAVPGLAVCFSPTLTTPFACLDAGYEWEYRSSLCIAHGVLTAEECEAANTADPAHSWVHMTCGDVPVR